MTATTNILSKNHTDKSRLIPIRKPSGCTTIIEKIKPESVYSRKYKTSLISFPPILSYINSPEQTKPFFHKKFLLCGYLPIPIKALYADIFITLKTYPKQAVIILPTGNNIVSTNISHIRMIADFFILQSYSFPNIFAYLSEKTFDITQNNTVKKIPSPKTTPVPCNTSKNSVKLQPTKRLTILHSS